MQEYTEKPASGAESQFQPGHRIPIQHQKKPGLQAELEDPKPASTRIPTDDYGYQTYKAAGKLAGKRAIITGGDSGIGRAVAILFAMEGASSLIVYLPEEERDAQETRRRVQEAGKECHCLAVDLRKRENCQKVVEVALQCLGGIDILVNNAAFQNMVQDISELDEYALIPRHSLLRALLPSQEKRRRKGKNYTRTDMISRIIDRLIRDQWHRTFDTNIHPYFYLSKYSLPHMRSGSTIINCASVNHYIGRGDLLDYTSTKGAIVAFTRGLSNQQIGKGIRVNCVCPGPIWTPLIPSTMDTSAMEQFSSVPMGRPGQPSEVATCFVFLASHDSSYISGQSLHPNGGVMVNG